MNPEIRKKILLLHAKGLSRYYISTKLKITPWQAQEIIEERIK